MGKAKIPKKSSSPVKISSSLFNRKKAKQSTSTDSSTDSSSIPSPKQSTLKKKVIGSKASSSKTKGTKKTTVKTKPSTPSSKKQKSVIERKKKVGTKQTAQPKEKSKKNELSKGSTIKKNQSQGKTKSKEKSTATLKSKKEITPKSKRKPVVRRRNEETTDSEDDSSSGTSTDDTSSSRTRTPSPPRKIIGKSNSSKSLTKSKLTTTKKEAQSPIMKSAKGVKTKEKGGPFKKVKLTVAKKGSTVKPKAKQTKPKGKVKRMASLNAKAILEASFSFEAIEKKKSPAGTPVKSIKGGSGTTTGTNTEEADGSQMDFKPLTLLLSSVDEKDFTKEIPKSPKSGERKRKATSSAGITGGISPIRKDTTSCNTNGDHHHHPKNDGHSTISTGGTFIKIEKEKSKSPGPKKKAKVTSSSVSTSTSPFDSGEESKGLESLMYEQPLGRLQSIGFQQHPGVIPDPAFQRNFTLPSSAFHHHHHHHHGQGGIHSPQEDPTNQFHHQTLGTPSSTLSKGRGISSSGSLSREKINSTPSSSISPFGSTVYQPAGPLIEPHKTSSLVPSGVLIDTVRIPSDLKVTYQTRPPSSTVIPSPGIQTLKGPETKKSSGYKSSSTASSKSNSKQILHQPYKLTSTTSTVTSPTPPLMTVTASTKQSQSTTFIHSPLALNSATFSSTTTGAGSLIMPTGGGSAPLSSGSLGTLSQSAAALPSHLHPSSTILTSGGGSGTPGSLYFGYGSPHQSPFAPSKFPIVPPDTFRTPSPFQYLYPSTTPPQQIPPNHFMTAFYSPSGTASGLAMGSAQPRQLFAAHHHPTAGSVSSLGAQFYSPPPTAHPVSNYYVTPQLQPQHHSIQPTTAPGHAGLSLPNPSSQPACPCPTESSPNNNSISNNSSTTNITISSNNKANRSLLRKLQQQQQPAISVTLGQPATSGQVGVKSKNSKSKLSNKSQTVPKSSLLSQHQSSTISSTSEKLPVKSKGARTNTVNKKTILASLNRSSTITSSQLIENAKTFTEQYSLPDDITITPIIMTTNGNNALTITPCGNIPPPKPEKKKDVVHIFDPRSGESTTISKHMSINNIHRHGCQTPRNVSQVKPNNAGNVGKISPSLDVIVLNPERKPQLLNKLKISNSETGQSRVHQKSAHSQRPSQSLPPQLSSGVRVPPPVAKSVVLSSPNTNFVQPFLQQKSENRTKAAKRKGLTLDECIDGLQRKKLRILADTNISFANISSKTGDAGDIPPTSIAAHHQLTILTTDNQGHPVVVNNLELKNSKTLTGKALLNQRDKECGKVKRQLISESNRRLGPLTKRTTSTESDFGTKIIDCNAAMVAVSALVIPGATFSSELTLQSPPIKPYSLHCTGMKKRQQEQRKKETNLKIKLLKPQESGGKITTRSATQNSKVRSRRTKVTIPEEETPVDKKGTNGGRRRGRLLIRDKDGNKSDSSGSIPLRYPIGSGNGSSTLTTSNNHVILRIPKSTSEKTKGDFQSQHHASYPIGNMKLNALKKRAIVKPLSPSLVNGALHTYGFGKKLPIHPNPRWSNGWIFEGKSFEAKVYTKNDDNPVLRRCYPTIRHVGGDIIRARDCVLLKSGPRKTDVPFVAKVAALFENPADGEMMFSLLWYYRPEHTDIGRNKDDMTDEIFASKHRDSNSVATIEDKCYVFTFNEYCRYQKRLKQLLEGVPESIPIVPLSKSHTDTRVPTTNMSNEIANAVWFGLSSGLTSLNSSSSLLRSVDKIPSIPTKLEPTRSRHITGKVSPEVVFFCRRVYDYRQKRMLKNPS